ncbi:MAG: hypothetical protein ACP5OC_08960 [Thermoplasmata archaeon]
MRTEMVYIASRRMRYSKNGRIRIMLPKAFIVNLRPKEGEIFDLFLDGEALTMKRRGET